ncbi:host attachment protein [Sphingomonas koreensis]|nr:host attachment protein [Sphingomonas koreensis]
MHVPHDAFVVVADGRKMLFLRNDGDAEYPNLIVERVLEQDNPATRDQGTDAPGSSSSSVGSARSSFEQTDFHQVEEDRFAAETADRLKKRALNNDFESLIIVAPPRTLGELRKHYHKEVSSRLIGELDKDLTGHPVNEIEAALKNA